MGNINALKTGSILSIIHFQLSIIMIIGVPKEIKSNENRVALTPAGAMELTRRGHTVYIETTAGVGSGFDEDRKSVV